MLLNVSGTVGRVKLFGSPASDAAENFFFSPRRKTKNSLDPRVVASPNKEKQDTFLPSFLYN